MQATSTRNGNKQEKGCYGEIAQIVANTNGLYNLQTKGKGDHNLLNRMWRIMGELLEEILLKKRSAVVPEFLHASIKEQRILYFDEKIHPFYKPQLVLLPDFTSKYHVKNVLVMPDAHYHATVPMSVSFTTIAQRLGVDRYVVEAGMKDSIREIGKYMERNKDEVLTIDIGVAFLEFRFREYRIKWSEPFLQRLRSTLGPQTIVTPHDVPSMTQRGPEGPCRFQEGAITKESLRGDVANVMEEESRTTVAEMNDGMGGSGYRRTYW